MRRTPMVPDGSADKQGVRPSAGTFACVVDDHPRFHLDALRWFAALTNLARVAPADLVVHVVGSESDALTYLRSQGVSVRAVEAFDARSPHCNKISGARSLAAAGVDGMAVLCDTDVAILEDPRTLKLPTKAVASKPVDVPNPPLDLLTGIFDASGLPLPPSVDLQWDLGHATVAGNTNGGLYLIPGPVLTTVTAAWARWAVWLLDRPDLLQRWAVHVDQVAMALALADEAIEPVALDVRWNTPVHDLTRIPHDAPPPAVIHYHEELDPTGCLRMTGTASIDHQIEAVNEAISDIWRRAFPNATFWQWRYLTDPDLGSGVGSRGQPLRDKREFLTRLLDAVRPESLLDVGCGDGEATRDLPIQQYTGIDLSEEAVRRAKLARPDGEILVGSLTDHAIDADLVLCLDVLIHQPAATSYRNQLELLWRSAGRALVVSGYERSPSATSPMVHFHEPLSATLRVIAPEAEVYPVRREHEITTFVALKPPRRRHPRDFGPDTLAPLVANHPDPLWLAAIRLHAWQTVTFYPDHAPRLWEYPVVAQLIEDLLPPASRIVDVGAGVAPLAPFLAARGYSVDTVDPSPVRRSWPPQPDWNEWEFLDYGQAGLAHRSWNCVLAKLPLKPQFDAAYSVSVIEHLPAADRRALVADISSRVRPGGVVVLTVDLARNGDDLWNRNRGAEVEEQNRHGTLHDVIREGRHVGLDLLRIEAVRDWGETQVDIGLLVLRRSRRKTGAARSASSTPSPARKLSRITRAMRGVIRRTGRGNTPGLSPCGAAVL